jgi:hypothetical protein
LYDLKNFLPKRPGEVELKVAMEMLEASIAGEPFDTARWGDYYKPKGAFGNGGGAAPSEYDLDEEPVAPVPKAAPAPTISNDVAAAIVATAPASGDAATRAQDILAKIRSRNAQ